jgi:hypothetical protein
MVPTCRNLISRRTESFRQNIDRHGEALVKGSSRPFREFNWEKSRGNSIIELAASHAGLYHCRGFNCSIRAQRDKQSSDAGPRSST